MAFKIPNRYRTKLTTETTELAIKEIKDAFQKELSVALNLRRVTAPLFVLADSGINDNLTGVEQPISFQPTHIDSRLEIVHSLAKWKRMRLASCNIAPGYGIYTDMNAIRTFEELDNTHSLYVDQWDWEQTINKSDRCISYLKETVGKIYKAIKAVEKIVYEKYPHITPTLPEHITFLNAEDLLHDSLYKADTPEEREYKAAKEHGAVFIIGIGHKLSNGQKHGERSPDYDDWSTQLSTVESSCLSTYTNAYGYGMNGDLIVWNTVLDEPLELSSMGIRVDKKALQKQLELCNCTERLKLPFHKALMNDELPYSIGGGIGQSRLCMFLLQKAHIGEVQSSVWPADMIEECNKHKIELL